MGGWASTRRWIGSGSKRRLVRASMPGEPMRESVMCNPLLLITLGLANCQFGPTDHGSADPAQMARVRAIEAARIALVNKLTPTVVCIFPKGNRNGGGS